MNFLDLCKDVARQSGTLAGGVGSFTSVTSPGNLRAEKIINWTADAWNNIQIEYGDWLWMQREFVAPLTIGFTRYNAADLGIARFGSWRKPTETYEPFSLYDPAIGKADEGAILAIPYDRWRARYDRGAHDANRPTEYAVSPLGQICVGAKPDKAYMLAGEYQLSPQVLAANADVPEMPVQYHKAIVWEAVKLLAASDEAPTQIQTSLAEYARIRDALDREQRPEVVIGFSAGPIA